MKKSFKITVFVLIAVAAVVVWFLGFRKKEVPIVLSTENPGYGYISKSVTATGTIEPVDTVTVGTQVSGTIRYLYADFNSNVKKGQLIAELDKSLLQAQANQFRANLEVVKSNLTYQQSNFDRQGLLYNAGAISKADYETAQNQYNSTKANVNSVQAQLDAAIKNLSYASIYSPVNGVVLTRNINIGQTVAASFSTPTLFIIAKDITKMQVQAAVDEADIGHVSKGQRVTFTVDAFPEDVFEGTVQQIRLQPAVSANVVTYTTIISASNNDLKLKPGMTANIIIYTIEENNALLIPAKALKFKPDSTLTKQYKIIPIGADSGGHPAHIHRENPGRPADSAGKNKMQSDSGVIILTAFVWVKKNDSLLEKKIKTGLNDETNVQVLDGLSVEDEVVTGIKQGIAKTVTASTAKSPFMPQRPNSRKPAPKKQ
jgi:HlyD family secretion protein